MTSIMWPSLVIGINFIVLIISQLCLAASLSTVANATSTCSNETDKIALLAFKDFITEDPLGILSSWNDSVHLCEWQGVKRSSRDWRDVELNLRSQKLAVLYRVKFQATCRAAETLRVIDLNFNDLVGEIPATSKLTYLSLFSNNLHGIIPPSLDSFTNLSTKLRILDAGGNQFAGDIPAGMPKYFNLIQLGLDRNCLSEINSLLPSQNPLATSLYSFQLNLAENNLTGNIPESLENLTSLQILNLSCNQLGGSIPKPSGLFSTLSSIDFAHNNFNGSLPLEVGSLSNTQELDFSEHMLSGEIPITLGNRSKFEHLLLGGTIDLNLSHNNLSGTIPKELETLPFLENLNLSFNNFEGQLPSMSVFTNTSVISIVGNGKLCGGVPELRLLSCAIESSKKQIHHLGSSMDSGGNDFKALAFEFMPSGSLESWLHPNEATRRLDLAEGLKIAVDIVAAFGLSSSPLRNTNYFGLARFLPTNVTNPMKGQSNSAAVWGSIGYVPPGESILNMEWVARYQHKGKGYSCGILLLEIMTGKRPTDEMFADCLSLHNFCKMALPERVMELVYSRLLQGVDKDAEDEPCMKAKIRECLTSLGRIGIASLTETPNERMGVREMVMEMNVIKEVLLGVRINGERRIRKNATN
ncbi:protein kinase domain-containing protein [Citrus sinensis]|nr:protein kinase domain-containing protein [Citrus sinensis]